MRGRGGTHGAAGVYTDPGAGFGAEMSWAVGVDPWGRVLLRDGTTGTEVA